MGHPEVGQRRRSAASEWVEAPESAPPQRPSSRCPSNRRAMLQHTQPKRSGGLLSVDQARARGHRGDGSVSVPRPLRRPRVPSVDFGCRSCAKRVDSHPELRGDSQGDALSVSRTHPDNVKEFRLQPGFQVRKAATERFGHTDLGRDGVTAESAAGGNRVGGTWRD